MRGPCSSQVCDGRRKKASAPRPLCRDSAQGQGEGSSPTPAWVLASLGTAVRHPDLRTKAPSVLNQALDESDQGPRVCRKSSSKASPGRGTAPPVHAPLIPDRGRVSVLRFCAGCSGRAGRQGEPPRPPAHGPPACLLLSRRRLPTGPELAQTFSGFTDPVLPSVHTAGRGLGPPSPGRAPH